MLLSRLEYVCSLLKCMNKTKICFISQCLLFISKKCTHIIRSQGQILLFLLLHCPAISLGFTIVGEIFAYLTSYILFSSTMYAGCVIAIGICPSRTWMSGSFESVWWNTCVHRLDLGLYSNLKELGGNGVRSHVNSKGKSPPPEKFSLEEDWINDTASSRTVSPTHYQRAIPVPQGQS